MHSRRQDPVDLAFLLLALATLSLLGLMLWRCGAGLDFTDEGLYLNSIDRPWQSRFTSTLFGFVYHPLYSLLGSDIVMLRQASMLATFASAMALVFALLRNAASGFEPCEPIGLKFILSAIVLAAPSLAFYRVWIATPGYNSLNLQGVLLALTGVAWFTGQPGRAGRGIGTLMPAVLTGFGGWLVFMAKPTSAILLAAAATGVALARGRVAVPFLACAAATALAMLVLTAVLIDGGIASFVARVADGMVAVRTLSPDYDIWSAFRLDPLKFNASEARVFWALTIAALTLAAIATSLPKIRAATAASAAALATAASAYWLLSPQSLSAVDWIRPPSSALLAAAPAGIAIMIAYAAIARRTIPRPETAALALALVISPYIFAYGTKSNIFHIVPAAFVMVTAATAYGLHKALERARARSLSAILGAAGVAVTTLVVVAAMERPYRLSAPLRLQETVLAVGQAQSRIRVDAETARYVEALRQAIGARADVTPAVIDVTGRSPGALFAAGALPIGLSWMIGSLPGSEAVAADALRKVDCLVLSESWILSEDQGKRALPSSVLDGIGRRLSPTIELTSPDGGEMQLTPPEAAKSAATARCRGLRR